MVSEGDSDGGDGPEWRPQDAQRDSPRRPTPDDRYDRNPK